MSEQFLEAVVNVQTIKGSLTKQELFTFKGLEECAEVRGYSPTLGQIDYLQAVYAKYSKKKPAKR